MSTQQLIADNREGAEICNGAALCEKKCQEILTELNLPGGLLPLSDLTEVGYNRTTGFLWLKQKQRYEHKFTAIGRNVSYDTEVTAFAENRRMRKVTGVKTKELLIWVKIVEMSIENPESGKLTFGSGAGISKSFPISAFELDKKAQN